MSKVTIYTTPTCAYCKMTKEFFREHNVSYEEKNVAEDKEAREEMIQKTGQLGVPTIFITKDDQEHIVVGFDKGKLSELLEIKN